MENRNTIKIASELSDVEAMRVNDILCGLDSGEGLCFDFTGIKFARPYGMLCLAQSIREFRDRHSSEITFKWTKRFDKSEDNSSSLMEKILNSHPHPGDLQTACCHMGLVGFFEDAGFTHGSKVDETILEITKYIPITKIPFQKFYESYEDAHALLEQKAKAFAKILVSEEQVTKLSEEKIIEYRKILQYVIFEALRNAMEHSDADCVRICGQRWDNGCVEIAVLDDGIGVLESLKENTLYSALDSERDALMKAVNPGVSRNHISKRSNRAMDNSGYGLYMLRRFAEDFGSFLLGSNGATLEIIKGGDGFENYSKITGTSLRIIIDMTELLRFRTLHESLKRYRNQSESPVKPSASSMATNIK